MDEALITQITNAVRTAVTTTLQESTAVMDVSQQRNSQTESPISGQSINSIFPYYEDKISELKMLVDLRLPTTEIATPLNISRPTVYKLIRCLNLQNTRRYSDITDNELDNIIREIKEEHEAAGQIITQGHLRARGIHVQRQRLHMSLTRIDPLGIQQRRLHTIRRRFYSVPGPNFYGILMELIRWRLVLHAGINGYSRLIIFAQCSNNNRADTVLALFKSACLKYGLPLRVRTDEGGENVCVWENMNELFPATSNLVIVGSSVHNQRIERMHRDFNEQVVNYFYNIFHGMEEIGTLNPENETDIFCLHYVFIPLINKWLSEFVVAHNNHNISTEGNYTPLQLFLTNFYKRERQQNASVSFYGGIALSALDRSNLPHVNVPAISSPLTDDQYNELVMTVDTHSNSDPVELFRHTAAFVMNCMNR